MLRMAELIATLSVATDVGLGQPMEWELRGCLLSLRLADRLGLNEEETRELYYVSLLRWVGCTGHAHEVSRWFGDEIGARRRSARLDMSSPVALVRETIRHGGGNRPALERILTVVSMLGAGPKALEGHFRASCEVAQMLTERLGLDAGVRASLMHAFERWDGRGYPSGVRGRDIALSMRVVQVAQDALVFDQAGGPEAASGIVRRRSGRAYDPEIAALFCAAPASLLDGLSDRSTWERVVAAEPAPRRSLKGRGLDAALEVMADFVDLKSPYTAGHSRGVAILAAEAAAGCGLDAPAVSELRLAGLIHDLGRTAISNAIWDKAGPLTDAEWERVRLHVHYGERLLSRTPAMASIATLAGSHHERIDGSGYHRSARAPGLSMPARVLAAADSYQAMTQPRAHREPLGGEQAAAQLRDESRAGRLDPAATEAVLAVAGHRVRRRRSWSWPGGLSEREVQVLRLAALGLPNRETALRLDIAERTVGHHVQHVYAKIGVSTRGAAALWAMQNGLVSGEWPVPTS